MFSLCSGDHILISKNKLEQNWREIVNHLQKTSRTTIFMLDRVTSENVHLTSISYRKFPLVRGGLEIRCKISIKTDASFYKTVFEGFKDAVKGLYIEPMKKTDRIILARENYASKFAEELRRRKRSIINIYFKQEKVTNTPRAPPKLKDISSSFENYRKVTSDKR